MRSLIIDAHVHVGSWDHPDFLGRGCTLEEALAELRGAGVNTGGPAPLHARDRMAFANALDGWLAKRPR